MVCQFSSVQNVGLSANCPFQVFPMNTTANCEVTKSKDRAIIGAKEKMKM